jgi:hypothetical protein
MSLTATRARPLIAAVLLGALAPTAALRADDIEPLGTNPDPGRSGSSIQPA